MELENYKKYAPAVLRIGMALVFLWFSLNQFFFVNDFVNYIPSFLVETTGYSPAVFVMANALFEFIFGMFLLVGIHVRISSFLLGLHLLGISSSLGYNQIMIRDLGLAIATFAVFLNGRDVCCAQKPKKETLSTPSTN